jgi:hypothetical protein
LFQEIYYYNGQQITSGDISEIRNGSFEYFAKYTLSYDSDLLKDILVSLKDIGSWKENARFNLNYLNGELQSSGLSFFQDGTWYQAETRTFNYDEDENLTGELRDNLYHYDVEKIEYTYENKAGNARDFLPPWNWVTGGLWYPQITKLSHHATSIFFRENAYNH